MIGYLQDHFGPTRLDAIRPRHVAALHPRPPTAPSPPRPSTSTLNVLHDVFKVAGAEEHIASNPVTGVERPKATRNTLEDPRAPRGATAL